MRRVISFFSKEEYINTLRIDWCVSFFFQNVYHLIWITPKDKCQPIIFDILIQGNKWPVSFFMQEVLEKTHLSSEFFNLYLHQNYLEFSADIDDVVGKECPTKYF